MRTPVLDWLLLCVVMRSKNIFLNKCITKFIVDWIINVSRTGVCRSHHQTSPTRILVHHFFHDASYPWDRKYDWRFGGLHHTNTRFKAVSMDEKVRGSGHCKRCFVANWDSVYDTCWIVLGYNIWRLFGRIFVDDNCIFRNGGNWMDIRIRQICAWHWGHDR